MYGAHRNGEKSVLKRVCAMYIRAVASCVRKAGILKKDAKIEAFRRTR